MKRRSRLRRRRALRRLAGEAVANVVARPILSIGVAALIAAVLVAVAVSEANSAVSVRKYEEGLAASGYSTLLIEHDSHSKGTFTDADCRAFGRFRGVQAEVSLREPDSYRLWDRSGPEIPVRLIAGDVGKFLSASNSDPMPQWRTAQVLVDTRSWAASSGHGEFPLRLDSGGDVTTTAALTSGLTAFGGGAVGNIMIIDATVGAISTCALFVPSDRRASVERSAAAAARALDGFSQRWAFAGADKLERPADRFEHRATRFGWLMGAGVFIAVWVLVLRLRRNDYALYAVTGLRSGGVAVLAMLELGIVVVSGVLIASTVLLGAAARAGAEGWYMSVGLVAAGRSLIALAGAAAACCVSMAARSGSSTLNALKDR